MDIQAKWSFPPALQSPWFVPHVLVYMISYIFAAVAGAMVLSKLLVKDKKRIDGGVYELVSLLFPMMTMGMLMGAIWANEVWGGFWSFDIKECWSLVTWLTYALYLHVRRSTRFNKYKDILVLLGLVFVIITFIFVNGMAGAASSQHTYG
jgi:ABC-type transport system involved in cytochrome c biogenesis permease subunit